MVVRVDGSKIGTGSIRFLASQMPWSSISFADLITFLRGNLMLLSSGGCSLYLFHSERKSAGGDSFISMESLMPRLAEAASLLERSLAQVILIDRKFWHLQS